MVPTTRRACDNTGRHVKICYSAHACSRRCTRGDRLLNSHSLLRLAYASTGRCREYPRLYAIRTLSLTGKEAEGREIELRETSQSARSVDAINDLTNRRSPIGRWKTAENAARENQSRTWQDRLFASQDLSLEPPVLEIALYQRGQAAINQQRDCNRKNKSKLKFFPEGDSCDHTIRLIRNFLRDGQALSSNAGKN